MKIKSTEEIKDFRGFVISEKYKIDITLAADLKRGKVVDVPDGAATRLVKAGLAVAFEPGDLTHKKSEVN